MLGAFEGWNVYAGALRDRRHFEFVVHHRAVARPADGDAGTNDRLTVGDVISRDLFVDSRKFTERRDWEATRERDDGAACGHGEPRAVRADFLVERRGFEPVTLPHCGHQGAFFGGAASDEAWRSCSIVPVPAPALSMDAPTDRPEAAFSMCGSSHLSAHPPDELDVMRFTAMARPE